MAEENLFKKLTTLFRSGPTVKRKVKQYKGVSSPSSLEMFKKAHSDVYNSTISAYGSYDRMARYSDFSEMESTPEICSALDIYSEECVAADAVEKPEVRQPLCDATFGGRLPLRSTAPHSEV